MYMRDTKMERKVFACILDVDYPSLSAFPSIEAHVTFMLYLKHPSMCAS